MRTPLLPALLVTFSLMSAPWSGARADEAESYPTRPIRLVVGFTPGGGNDILARAFGQKLTETFGQPVVIENKPGAGAMVATEYVARQPADGYTLLVGASGAMVISPAVYDKMSYDTVRDFVPISQIASFPLILVVNASSPIKSLADLIAFSKKNPGQANYSSSSSAFQLATELFKQKSGAPFQMIPYKGANDSVTAVMSGEVTMTLADPSPASGQIAGNTVRAIAVTSPGRMAEFPEVPTMKEAGADVEVTLWSGVFAPKNTSPAIVAKLQKEFIRIAKTPDIVAKMKVLNLDAEGTTSAEFAQVIAADLERWATVARNGAIKAAP
jgi:tripartite-type tricarboxylate transporter receptor subunit TctC